MRVRVCVERCEGRVFGVKMGTHCGALNGRARHACAQQRIEKRALADTGLTQNDDVDSVRCAAIFDVCHFGVKIGECVWVQI